MDSAAAPSFFLRHEFLLRRLHSLSGLIPVGAYMCIHLLTNATVLGGPASFQEKVDMIHSLGPFLPFVEWTFIFLPILFHAIVGVWIVRSGQSNVQHYGYANNVRYTLQRATAWIALFFIGWHVFHMHGWLKFEPLLGEIKQYGGSQFDPHHATSSVIAALQSNVYLALYIVGVLSTVFHLANGIWTMGITWGAWTSPAAQRRADVVCAVFGLLLAAIGLSALWGFRTADRAQAQAYEQAQIEIDTEQRQLEQRILRQRAQPPLQQTSKASSERPAPH